MNKNILALADQGVFSGGSFALTLLLAHILVPEKFGVFSSFLLINYAVVNVLNALVIQPLQVKIAKVAFKEHYIVFNVLFQSCLILFVWCTFQVIKQLPFFQYSIDSQFIFLVELYCIGFVMNDFFRKLFLANGDMFKALWIDSVTVLFQLIWLLQMYYNKSTDFQTVLIGLVSAYGVSLLSGFLLTKWVKVTVDQVKDYFKQHIQEGKWLLVTAFTQWWAGNLFIVSAGYYLGIKAFGAFRLVQSLFGVLNLVFQTFENFVLPETSRKFIQSKALAIEYLRSITIKSAILFAGVLTVLFVFSESFMVLAGGKQYIEYAYIVKGMTLLYLIIFLAYPIRLSIRLLELNNYFFYGYLISFVYSILAFDFLLNQFEIIGAVIGLIGSQVLTMSFWLYILSKHDFKLWK